jgi:DUF971 family protein
MAPKVLPPARYGAGVAQVTDVEVDRERAVTITFDDGTVTTFGLEELRRSCPCATCRSWRERGEVAWPRPGAPVPPTIVDAELVGAWGISFRWNDGHSTGIYSWEILRSWREGSAG